MLSGFENIKKPDYLTEGGDTNLYVFFLSANFYCQIQNKGPSSQTAL